MQQIVVHKGRTTVISVSVGVDVSLDVITSEIRVGKTQSSELIATWVVTFATDGKDGELILTLDDSVSTLITKSVGHMDLKRVTAGQPLNVFDEPLEVIFKESITE